MMEPVYQKLKPEYRLIDPYYKVSQSRFILGTQDESGKPTTSERRMVWFGEGWLETQVMLCAGRPLYLVALHPDLTVIEQVQQTIADQLSQMGLELKPSKTRITHTLHPYNENLGFDFLGFHIRQYPVGKTHSGKTSGRNPHLLGFKTLIKPSQAALHQHWADERRGCLGDFGLRD